MGSYPDAETLLSDLKYFQSRSPWRCVVDLEDEELEELCVGDAWCPKVSCEGQVRLYLAWYRVHCHQHGYGPGEQPRVTLRFKVLLDTCPDLPESWRISV